MSNFMKFLYGIGIIPSWPGLVPFLISLGQALLICLLGFIIIYFICKTLNKSLFNLTELLDKDFTTWEKSFLKRLLWKYPLWGLVQQIAVLTIFYFAGKVFTPQWMLIIICSLIFACFHFPNIYLFLATFGMEQMLLYFFISNPNIYLIGFIHGFLGTCLMYFSPPLVYTKFLTWDNYLKLYKKQ